MLKLRTSKKEYCVPYKPDPKGPVLAKFYGCPLSPSEIDKLMDQYRITEWDSPDRRSQKQRFQDFDALAIVHERVKRTITRWEDICDMDGSPISCTDENKVLVYEANPSVMLEVLEKFDEIARLEAMGKEEELGNSESGQTGTRKKAK